MKTIVIASFVTAAVLAIGSPVMAHHSANAEFDTQKVITITGTLTKVENVNPHGWWSVDVKEADGKVTRCMVEGGSPNALFRRGVTKDALPQGTEISVDGYQAKDGSNRANGRDITFADGKKLFVGGSNPDEQPNAK
jgi:hypothetical protein